MSARCASRPSLVCVSERPSELIASTRSAVGALRSSESGVSTGTFQVGSIQRGRTFDAIYDEAGVSNNRCSFAVLVDADIHKGGINLVTHCSAGLRPPLGVKTSSGIWVYSIHAPSSGGAAGVASALLGGIQTSKWICAGDYNGDPKKMTKRNWTVSAPGRATHQNGNELDHAVCFNCTVSGDGLLGLMSDHVAVS